jgi:hypothetical protein
MPNAKHKRLLHKLKLTCADTVRVPAKTDKHQAAFARVHPHVLERLHLQESENYARITLLFSTKNVREAVSMRISETIHLKIEKRWVPLNITAWHHFTEGMRVSGVMHRAVVHAISIA